MKKQSKVLYDNLYTKITYEGETSEKFGEYHFFDVIDGEMYHYIVGGHSYTSQLKFISQKERHDSFAIERPKMWFPPKDGDRKAWLEFAQYLHKKLVDYNEFKKKVSQQRRKFYKRNTRNFLFPGIFQFSLLLIFFLFLICFSICSQTNTMAR